MAVVYRAHDPKLDRIVAIKILHPHLARNHEARARFEREAKAVARLSHNSIVSIHDYSGNDSSQAYIVTEFIDGTTLDEFALQNPIFMGEGAALIIHELSGALQHAHENSILHRDIKPENVMVSKEGEVKLMDFGIAQMLESQGMTMTGTLLGSPAHMSPEHIEGKQVDYRSDVYALGTVFYLLATGKLPFEAGNPHHLLKRIIDSDYTPCQELQPKIGKPLAKIIHKCLKKNPDDRYQSSQALQDAITEYLASVGLEEPKKELSDFLVNPRQWQTDAMPSVATFCVKHAQDFLESGSLIQAHDTVLRLKALTPNHKDVIELSDALEKALHVSRRKKPIYYVAACLAIIGLLLAWWQTQRSSSDSNWVENLSQAASESASGTLASAANKPKTKPLANKPVAMSFETQPLVPESTKPSTQLGTAQESTNPTKPATPKIASNTKPKKPKQSGNNKAFTVTNKKPQNSKSKESKNKPVTGTAKLQVWTLPMTTEVYLNGKMLGPITEFLKKPLSLSHGKNVVMFKNEDCCESITQVFHVSDNTKELPPFKRRLKWKPGRLVVKSNTPATIMLDNNPIGKTGLPISIPITDPIRREMNIELGVVDPNSRTLKLKTTIKAGDLTTVSVAF